MRGAPSSRGAPRLAVGSAADGHLGEEQPLRRGIRPGRLVTAASRTPSARRSTLLARALARLERGALALVARGTGRLAPPGTGRVQRGHDGAGIPVVPPKEGHPATALLVCADEQAEGLRPQVLGIMALHQ